MDPRPYGYRLGVVYKAAAERPGPQDESLACLGKIFEPGRLASPAPKSESDPPEREAVGILPQPRESRFRVDVRPLSDPRVRLGATAGHRNLDQSVSFRVAVRVGKTVPRPLRHDQ